MGYPRVLEIWYGFAGTLKELVNDFGTIELLNWFKTNGKVNQYIVHHTSQPDVIEIVDVQPVQTDVQPVTTESQPIEQKPQGLPDILETLPEIPEQNVKTIESDHNEQSDDSALGCRFNDSNDEVLNDGIDEVLVGLERLVVGQNDQHVDEL